MNKTCLFFVLLLIGLAACTPKPENIMHVTERAPIYPDYADITIPYNIAPLNFMVEGAERLQVTVYGSTDSLVISGKNKILFSIDKWKKFLLCEKGNTLQVCITARINGKWLAYPPFQWQVATEAIDSYLSYRLIEPGYEVWNNLQICERNTENFNEKILADNNLTGGNCMNCHTYSKQNGSVCFPKASQDGKYLLFTIADYGTFPIWHQETDLYMLNLNTESINELTAVNSNRSDTYHSWSSNSHWFVFASKRGDGQYGKPYFAYIDQTGKAHKPFVLPQEDPEYYFLTFKSYNIPELARSPLPFDAMSIKQVYEKVPAESFK